MVAGDPREEGGRPLFLRIERDEDERLDVLVGRLPEVGSRSQAVTLLDAGAVTVNGAVRPKSYRPALGEVVEVILPKVTSADLAAENIDVPIAYEDEWLLIADKPAGMVVHPSRGHASGTLVNALLSHGLAGGDAFRPGVVHRLDKDTSGLLLVAKSPRVHRKLTLMLRAKLVDRRYLALVHGSIAAPGGVVDAPIGRDLVRRKTMTIGGTGRREAVTRFRVLERIGDFTLVEVKLETGRTHQIRVHFLAIGHPVVGDPTYGRHDALDLGRQFLHSYRLALSHPVTGVPLEAESPLPPDLASGLELARTCLRR